MINRFLEKRRWLYFLIFIIFIGGIYLRYDCLKDKPVWIDEAKFYNELVSGDIREYREIIPVIIAKTAFNKDYLRFPFVFVSSFAILAIFMVVKDKKKAFIIGCMVAFTPIFYYWGGMARPYAIALVFTILGYRWKYFYIPAIITTPYALSGLNLWKIKTSWLYYVAIVFAGIFYYYSMDLSKLNHFNMGYLLNAKRLWIIPIINLLLHCADFDVERLQGLFGYKKRLAGDKV